MGASVTVRTRKTPMPLLGSAAMLLSFDVAAEALPEHDHWHSHEHLPERMSIPGFLRGTRWQATEGGPRYMVLYEVQDLGTLNSALYLARLNQPSPWTAKMMLHYRGMRRGFCAVRGSYGHGVGHLGALVRYTPRPEAADALRASLLQGLQGWARQAGLSGLHLLEGAAQPVMTREQSIRGADAGVDSALLLTGYGREALLQLLRGPLAPATLEQMGAGSVTSALYRLDDTLSAIELRAQASA
jgi:hypothetical protein